MLGNLSELWLSIDEADPTLPRYGTDLTPLDVNSCRTLSKNKILRICYAEENAEEIQVHGSSEVHMSTIRNWEESRAMWVRVLEKQTHQNLDSWNQLIRKTTITTEDDLRDWLTHRGVTGYARTLLVMERFGYPDFLTATADELISRQYAERPNLRPIYDAVINAAKECGEIIIQARKTYVSLVAPRRTFARIRPARNQVDLGLRLEQCEPVGRIEPSRIHHTMSVQIGLTSLQDVDPEVQHLLAQAYLENS